MKENFIIGKNAAVVKGDMFAAILKGGGIGELKF